MRRGAIVLAAIKGDFGKPRPFLVVQREAVAAEGYSTVMLCPLTSTVTGRTLCRVVVEAMPATGLRQRSEVMVEKATAAPRDRVRDTIGQVDDATMLAVERAFLFVLGIDVH